MGGVSIPDDLIHNILARLPKKPLMISRCVCKHWDRLISGPYFTKLYLLKSNSRRKILLPFSPVDVLDHNETTRSMVTLPSPNENHESISFTFVGSFKGIVLLLMRDHNDQLNFTKLFLYNPCSGASKLVPDLHSPCKSVKHVYGFGHGLTPDDLKIVRFRGCEVSSNNKYSCDIFSLKTNSWSMLKNFVQNDVSYLDDVGTFANGYLHWIAESNQQEWKIVALNVNNIVLSYIRVPCHGLYSHRWSLLGTLHGCLCIVDQTTIHNGNGFDVWVMNRKGIEKSWFKASSFVLNLKSEFQYSPISILDDGIILILINSFQELVIYDALTHSHKVINISASPSYFQRSHGIEYVESLVSPSSLFIA